MKNRSTSLLTMTVVVATFVLSHNVTAAQEDGALKPNQVIKPDSLVKILTGKTSSRPLVLQVGFGFLYRGGHVPGALWAGPASRPDGMKRLEKTVGSLPRNKDLIIYCGCCPWPECPNMRPAMAELHKLGFKDVKVIYIPINFEHDWIKTGLPFIKGKNPN